MRQLDDLALKSRSATTKKGLLSVNASKFNLKLSRNESKLSAVWLGDLWREKKCCKFKNQFGVQIEYFHLSSSQLLISEVENSCNKPQRLLSCYWRDGQI